MGHCNRNKFCKGNKHSCGCKNKSFNGNNSCGCNNNVNEDECSKCSKFKEMANEKCERANCLSNKAAKMAEQAKQAEERAECLKQKAIEECARANEFWGEYKQFSNEGLQLMKDAQACLAKSAECYANCYREDYGCDMSDFGYNPDNNNNNGNCSCNCNCGCNRR